MPETSQPTIYLQDYTPPAFLVDTIDLEFDLHPTATVVRSRMTLRRNPAAESAAAPLYLDGQELELLRIALDGRPLQPNDYQLDADGLTLLNPPQAFVLEIESRINPQGNTALEGLYLSNGIFCTQCEAEGFRKITFFPDRPDVMARFRTTITADRRQYPVLLSNGNPVERNELDDNRQRVTWEDPFPKPSYLFALVAGDLVCIEDQFTTASGREVALHLYVEAENRDQCGHAMRSLQKAMQWDEQVFGLEYDLDIYMVVAINDFNMGAMENKGLNVFNAKYVLASPETATDTDFMDVEAVIGHEYFHNWTGNRVTCRDWFQLSLKEGLTVFREQEFSADMNSRGVQRVADVRSLRGTQFPEDASPMAHPIRPSSYQEISNFYTATVYSKGAEVVRMLQTLLGTTGFRKGLALYLERHDGQAATTDQFVQAMEDASGRRLEQFRRWYYQAGTPVVDVASHYVPETQTWRLTLRQHCPAAPNESPARPFHIPFALALLDSEGNELPLSMPGDREPPAPGTRILELTGEEQTFECSNIPAGATPSLLRGFSAPVKVRYPYSDEQLAFLLVRDQDPFARWEAGQQLALRTLLQRVDAIRSAQQPAAPAALCEAFRSLLQQSGATADDAVLAQALEMPDEEYIGEQMETVDVDAIHGARIGLKRALADALEPELMAVYEARTVSGPYQVEPAAVGRRRLRNLCLALLMERSGRKIREICRQQFEQAGNMTDTLGALRPMANTDCAERRPMLDAFYQHWKDHPLVVDKWFALQAGSRLPGTLTEITALLGHPAFVHTNPNRVRALIGTFARANPVRFHAGDGEGYAFIADQILHLDPLNPQVAARLTGAFTRWRRYDTDRQQLMQAQLQRIAAAPDLSKDVREIVSKTLG